MKVVIEQEVKTLTSLQDKKKFLLDAYEQDQSIRNDIAEIVEKHGFKSTEYNNAIIKMDSIDSKNLYGMKVYLKQFGYPILANFGKIESYTPLLIFHHKGLIKDFREYFTIFDNAYKSGNITGDQWMFSLNRQYDLLHNKRFMTGNKAYSEEEIINNLIKALKLK